MLRMNQMTVSLGSICVYCRPSSQTSSLTGTRRRRPPLVDHGAGRVSELIRRGAQDRRSTTGREGEGEGVCIRS